MFDFLKRMVGGKRSVEMDDGAEERHHEAKAAGLQRLLGKQADVVFHALIPYQIGGTVDLYLFPHTPHGTAFVTMELIEADGTGPVPNAMGTYELAMFTRHAVTNEQANDATNPFRHAAGIATVILTSIARYAMEAKLKPGETAELPGEEGEDSIGLLFAQYPEDGTPLVIDGKKHGLLVVVRLHPSELAFARERGSGELVAKLKAAGHWPKSDMDRAPVA